jgi:hypothetical protein
MRTPVLAIVILMLGPWAPAALAQTRALAGTWQSEPERITLTSEFDRSVWGAGATSVRTTELAVQASGQATLTVTRQVVDAKGKTVPASLSVEEVRFTLGAAHPGVATRLEHEVAVTSAERRYPDDPGSRWPLDGVKVKVVTFTDGDPDVLEVRFDTPEGRGSFWETLRRAGGATNRRSAGTSLARSARRVLQ